MKKNPYRKRIQVAVDLLNSIITSKDNLTRQDVVNLLRKTYEKHRLKPLKGKANPPDLYDKEMASLYVVGKYGLALHEEFPEFFNNIFYKEEAFEKALQYIMNDEFEEAKRVLKEISPLNVVDSNTVARMLRIPFTKLLLGFITENEFSEILLKTMKAFPEEERTVKNYVKFYIAFKVAEAIYSGEVKSREYKEALKNALAIRLGFPRVVPSDEYVLTIAKDVFNIPDQILEKVISINNEGGNE